MAKKTTGKTVDSYLAGLDDSQREVAQAVRKLIRTTAPKLKETIKWGNPCYVGDGNVCAIIAYRDTVNMALFRGAELADKNPLIEGIGQGMRHVKFHSLADVRRKQVASIVRRAVQLDAAR